MKSNFARLLAKENNFARDDAVDVTFPYDFDDPRLAQLNENWALRQTAGEGDTQSRALNLMHWLCAHTIKGDPSRMPEGLQYHADGLLDWCFDHPGNDPNCMHLSIILSECLLAVGIKAYALGCYPKVYKNDNHVVVHSWLPEESRWILLDPSWDACFIDEAGRILSAPEVRGRLASGAPLRLNPQAKAFKGYPGYMAKDMYYFTRSGGKGLSAYLCPAGYPAPWKSPVYATLDSFWQ